MLFRKNAVFFEEGKGDPGAETETLLEVVPLERDRQSLVFTAKVDTRSNDHQQ
jgi:hypothetical protein